MKGEKNVTFGKTYWPAIQAEGSARILADKPPIIVQDMVLSKLSKLQGGRKSTSRCLSASYANMKDMSVTDLEMDRNILTHVC